MWSGRLLARYWALQLPATAILIAALLAFAGDWPRWIVWTIVAAWVAKDAALYPFVWRAYDPDRPATLPFGMEGAAGEALERIDPVGRVRVSGQLWRAELAHGSRPVASGETVKVQGRRGLTLRVEPEDPGPRPL